MSEISAAGRGIMSRLRDETMELHRETEQGPFQRSLMAGKLPLERYAELLHELLHLHVAVETDLRVLTEDEEAVRLVLRPYQFQEAQLRKDLHFFDRTPDSATSLSSTARLVAEIKARVTRGPIAILGVHYVLEGSKNGGRFIALAMQRAYGLQSGGLAYLDPYGDQQQARWTEFKASMESAGMSEAQQDQVVAAARLTFRGIIEIHRELFAMVADSPR